MSYDIERAKSHYSQCQALARKGTEQCPNQVCEGTEYCAVHGGAAQVAARKRVELHRFRKSAFLQEILDEEGSESLRSLTSEVAVFKVLLNRILNACQDDHDLYMQTPAISDLIVKTEKLVTSCHKLEKDMNQLLDRTQLMSFVDSLTGILGKNIQDEGLLRKISLEIAKAYMEALESESDSN